MQISVIGRRLQTSDALKQYARNKAAKLLKYYDRIQSIQLILDRAAGQNFVQVIAHAEHRNKFVAQQRGQDLYALVDLATQKLQRQIRRHKQRHRNRKHLPGRPGKALGL